MDAADATASPLGAWASIRGYFTPATLFLVLNLVIGTIALTSRSRDQRRRRRELHHHHDDYAHHLHDPQHDEHHYQEPVLDPHQQHDEYGHFYQNQQQEYATPQAPPAPLARTSSVLDRLRSIGLYRFRSGDFPPEYGAGTVTNHHDAAFAHVEEEEEAAKQYARKKSQTTLAPATRVVQEVAEDDNEVFGGSLRQGLDEPASPPQRAEHLPYQEYVPPPAPMRAPPPLSRTSSVLDRLRSLGLYNFLAADQHAAPAIPSTDAAPVSGKKQPTASAHYDRTRSEPKMNKEKNRQVAVPESKMAKSSSSTARKASPSLVSQPSVNTRAEAFIDSFRKGQQQHHHNEDDDDDEHVVTPPLARTSSVLNRLRSFSLYLRPGGDPAVPEDPYYTTPAADDNKQAAHYARSRSEPARDQGKKKKAQQAKMSKTGSETNIAEEAPAPVEECVDARADDFINKFRQQLQLQRLNSLLSYGAAKQ